METFAEDIANASATIAAPNGEEQLRADNVTRMRHEGPGAVYEIQNTGSAALYVNVTTAGLPKEPETEAHSEGLAVHRTILSSMGAPVDPNELTTATQYVVRLELQSEGNLENVVLADLLPAGFEVANPRLNTDAVPEADISRTVNATYVDIRDDRLILAFDQLSHGKHTYHYVVHAVTPGRYQHPQTRAECMYDASVHGASAAGQVHIVRD
jgi:uncharacterized protein YfaS (alpha-2-macroglobulin family)